MKKKCLKCGEEIGLEKDKYVLLGTYNGTGKSKKNEDFFHFKCWIDYLNEKIIQRISIGQEHAMKMIDRALKNLKVNVK
jgi:hypothetical protein